MGIRVGIDTGGTFTDLVTVDDRGGEWYVAKVPSSPKGTVAPESVAGHSADDDADAAPGTSAER